MRSNALQLGSGIAPSAVVVSGEQQRHYFDD